MWALAIKSTLGNVYHVGKLEDGSALGTARSGNERQG